MLRGYHSFIVQIPEKYRQSFKTESGVEIHASRQFSLKRVANTVVTCTAVPFGYQGPVKDGMTVLIDPTILSWQFYTKGGEQPNINLIDRHNHLYKVDPSMLIAYQEKGEWKAHNDNILLTKIIAEEKTMASRLIVHPRGRQNYEIPSLGKVFICPDDIGIAPEDKVYYRDWTKVEMFIDGTKPVIWVRTRDIFAKLSA